MLGRTIIARATVPRGTVHGFTNASSDDATHLVIHQPGGFEQFLEAMQELTTRNAGTEERAALAARKRGDEMPGDVGPLLR